MFGLILNNSAVDAATTKKQHQLNIPQFRTVRSRKCTNNNDDISQDDLLEVIRLESQVSRQTSSIVNENNPVYILNNNTAKTTTPVRRLKRRRLRQGDDPWRDVTKELAMFVVKRHADNRILFGEEVEAEPASEEMEMEEVAHWDKYDQLQEDKKEEPLRRQKKHTKKLKLKVLLRSGCITSKDVSLSFNSLTKGTSPLYVKYHVLNKLTLPHYVPAQSRSRAIYASRLIDARSHRSAESVRDSKRIHRELAVVDSAAVAAPPEPRHQYALDHSYQAVDEHFAADDMYLEFLISLQHRDITPEDYDYLNRLDERVAKKTLSAGTLDALKCETLERDVDEAEEACGICLEGYTRGQVRKELPKCGHKFHAECIDAWLRDQSVTCPLDKIPVGDESEQETVRRQASVPAVVQRRRESQFLADAIAHAEYEDDEKYECTLNDDDIEIICAVSELCDNLVSMVEAF